MSTAREGSVAAWRLPGCTLVRMVTHGAPAGRPDRRDIVDGGGGDTAAAAQGDGVPAGHGVDTVGEPGADATKRPGVGERVAAWLSPSPAELLGLVLLLSGSVAATLLWWYGSVAGPDVAQEAPGVTGAPAAGTPLGDDTGGSRGSVEGAADDPVAPLEGPSPEAPPPDGPSVAAPTVDEVLVHVSGAVRRPGLLALPPGARVGDAVAAAGGLTEDADGAGINLARVLADGEQVHVPAHGEERSPEPPAAVDGQASGASPGGAVDADGRVDINHAGAAEFETLPGIGPTRAAAIVAHREEHGPFGVPGDLRAVSGIGEVTFQNLAPLIVVR